MNIGIITYHAAYNFGSVLQAYATQEVIKELGTNVELINYRMVEQKRFYSLYRLKYGKLNFIQDLLMLPLDKKRRRRKKNFELFMKEYMNLSMEFSEPSDMKSIAKKYEIIISGSDQIWNKHSCEMTLNEWRYMCPYLLKDLDCIKISYATSSGHMQQNELKKIAPYIKEYNMISMREAQNAKIISKLINRDVPVVLDPTFLLSKDEWIEKLHLEKANEKPYVLYYSLKRFDGNKHLKTVIRLTKKLGYGLKVITPFSYFPMFGKHIENCIEEGPWEFLNDLYNSRFVITDSFHGTILSVNFEKEFVSFCAEGGAEFRKTDFLKQIGLEDRIIYDIADAEKKLKEKIDFTQARKVLKNQKKKSINYLKDALVW